MNYCDSHVFFKKTHNQMHVSAQVIERISKNWIDYHSEYVTQVLMHSLELILFKNMNLNSESSKVWYGAHHHKSAQ